MNTNWISIILTLIFIFYILYFILMPYSGSRIVGSSLSQLLSTSEQYIPTTVFASDSSGLVASIDLNNVYIPPKTIIMFYGDNVPSGWIECNGDMGTPDLRGRFPLAYNNSQGSTANRLGKEGGENRVQLDFRNIPKHFHTGTTDPDGWGTETNKCSGGADSRANNTGTHFHTFITDITGTSNNSHENRPPYFALKFIMKT